MYHIIDGWRESFENSNKIEVSYKKVLWNFENDH